MIYRVCTNCVLDSQDPNIVFDVNGICNYCNSYFERIKVRSEKPNKTGVDIVSILEKIKVGQKGRSYDCIIGLSGGVDSSYVAHLVKHYGLRPLAVHFDNGWNSELAVSNVEKLCSKLDIDLYTYVVNWPEFRDLQISFLNASVANVEAPTDHAIFAALYKLARKFKVRWIIDGVNESTEFVRPGLKLGGHVYSDLRHILAIHSKFGKVRLRTYPMMSYYKKLFYRVVLGIKQMSILNYVPYNKHEALKLLQEQYQWRSYGDKHHESLFTKWHQVIYLPKKFGFDKRRLHFSDMILSGQMTRADALAKLQQPPIENLEAEQLEDYVQKKLGLSSHQYQSILSSPPIAFDQYPNDEWLLELYAKFVKG